MDVKTLNALITEAKKNEKKAAAQFRKYDNSEDMHDEEMWCATARWLQLKIPRS